MRRALLLGFVLLTSLLVAPTAAAADPNPSAGDWVVSRTDITFTNLTHLDVDVTLQVHQITIPDGAFAGTYSAQDIRDTYATAERYSPGSGDALVQALEDNVTERIRARLAGVLPAGSDIAVEPAQADMATITAEAGKDAYHPPIVLTDRASADLDLTALLGDVDPAWVDAGLDVGAVLHTDLPLSARAGANATYAITLPEGLAFQGAGGGDLTDGGRTLTYTLTNWKGTAARTQTAALALHDPGAVTFGEEDVALDITLDLHGLDLNLMTLPSGNAGDIVADVAIRAELGVVELPDDMAAQLPESVELTHLSAGHIRHLHAEGVVTDAQVDALEADLMERLEAPLRERLGADVDITGGLDAASLAADGDMDAAPPIVFEVEAHVERAITVPPEMPQGAAAIALYQTDLPSFDLQPIEGFPTTYTVILPKGIAVTGVDAGGATSDRGVTDDGREYFTVTAADGAAPTTVGVAVTPGFVLHQLWPLLVVALLGLLLPVVLVVWRRRAKKRRRAAEAAAPTVAAAEASEPEPTAAAESPAEAPLAEAEE